MGKIIAPESLSLSVPFPTPLPLPQTCSQPWVGLEIPVVSRGFSNSRGGRDRAFSAKMGSLAPFLSKAGDLGDFPARYKRLNFIGKNLRAALRVGYSNGAGYGTLSRKSPGIHHRSQAPPGSSHIPMLTQRQCCAVLTKSLNLFRPQAIMALDSRPLPRGIT